MEEELNSKPSQKLNFKKFITRLFTNRKFLLTFGIVTALIIVEFTTDFMEIVLGSVLEITNPYRPKSGTIWEFHKKDRLASEQLEAIKKTLPDEKKGTVAINDLTQLKDQLEKQQSLLIPADQFRDLYNQLPIRLSGDVISPFDMLKLSHSKKWIWTKIIKSDSSLSFYFFDGDRQLLMDTYPPLSVLYNIPEADNYHSVSLDSMEVFKNRTFSRNQFFIVFDELPNSVKLRLINNPFQLVKWDANIQKVAISRYVADNTVSIGFQINQGIYAEVHTFEASDWAVDIFIEKLNDQYPELNYDFPEDRYSAFPDYF